MSSETEYKEYQVTGVFLETHQRGSSTTTATITERLNGRGSPIDNMRRLKNSVDSLSKLLAVFVVCRGELVWHKTGADNWMTADDGWKSSHIDNVEYNL